MNQSEPPAEPKVLVAAAGDDQSKRTLGFRVDSEIVERIEAMLPNSRRPDGRMATKTDVARAIMEAIVGDAERLQRLLAAPGASLTDKIVYVIQRGLDSERTT